MNAVFSRPNNDPYAPTYNPGWKITQISHGANITMTNHDRTMQATSMIPIILPIINPTFQITLTILPTIFQLSTKFSQPSSTIFLPESST